MAWRKNYQTKDKAIKIPSHFREATNDIVNEHVDSLLARLKGSFPTYSPRYIAHQLSDTTITSIIGALAGALYNSNNVTPEAGIVTVELEIEACNALSQMLGYRNAPDPPEDPSDDEEYEEQLGTDFSWCHLTSGGTVANIEALWVARTIKYFPLAVKDICFDEKIPLEIELAGGEKKDIGEVSEWDALGVKPSESIAMLSKFVKALMHKRDLSAESASAEAWKELSKSPFSPAKGLWAAYEKFKPCILATGAAHYSTGKAVDLLGLGRASIIPVAMDEFFRMDMADLSKKVEEALKSKKCIIAVIGTAGTTEEGAVDPIHGILQLRRSVEKEHNQSFWVHVDAAWGGFFRSLFVEPHGEKLEFIESLGRLRRRLSQPPYDLPLEENPADDPRTSAVEIITAVRRRTRGSTEKKPGQKSAKAIVNEWFERAEESNDYSSVLQGLREFCDRISADVLDEFSISPQDRIEVVKRYTRDILSARVPEMGRRAFDVCWPYDDEVGRAFLAFGKSDSITIDPHKMGYQVYPCGAIAFRNDRIRHFIQQEAAYVTLARTEGLVHRPIRVATARRAKLEGRGSATQAFASFTLEGSRPSGPACSLWLASQAMPFDRDNHGSIVRSSTLAARYLYELIDKWQWIKSMLEEDIAYRLVLFSRKPPDTNIVIFGVRPVTHRDIDDYNSVTRSVYDEFSIQKELGEDEAIYTQPFFLSKTEFKNKNYPYATLEQFLKKECDFRDAKEAYETNGLVVLRATVMNPHIIPTLKIAEYDFALEFMKQLDRVAQDVCMNYHPGVGSRDS